MNTKNKLNSLLDNNKGRFMGFVLSKRYNGYTFSGKVTKMTDSYVWVKPYSGPFRDESKLHKNSIKQLVVGKNRVNS